MNSTTRAGLCRGRIAAALVTSAVLATTAACGSNSHAAEASSTGSSAAAPALTADPPTTAAANQPAGAPAATAAPVPQVAETAEPVVAHPHRTAPIKNAVAITMPGMRYVVQGHLAPGVAAITLRNTDDEAHMMGISRLKPGVSLRDVKAALKKGEQAVQPLLRDGTDAVYGTPTLVGAGASSTVTSSHLPAGTYVLICFLNDAHGMPHYAMGMLDTMRVSGPRQSAKPKSDGTITLSDKAIRLPRGFDGRGTYLVKDVGTKEHNLSFAKLDRGTSLQAYAGYVGSRMNSGQAVDGGGGLLEGGVDALKPGQHAWVTLRLERGHYGYLSTSDITGPTLPPQHGEFDVR